MLNGSQIDQFIHDGFLRVNDAFGRNIAEAAREIHAAQPHRGTEPRFPAQPPLVLNGQLVLDGSDAGYSPVEQAIRLGIRKK